MIRPLRRQHRRVMDGLVIFLPLALVAGLWLRQPRPGMASLPSVLAAEAGPAGIMAWERGDLFTNPPVRTRLWQTAGNPPGRAIELAVARGFAAPDVLVYWTAGVAAPSNSLPADAILLGPLAAGGPLPLPARAGEKSGRLVLYSLANGAVIETSQPLPAGAASQ